MMKTISRPCSMARSICFKLLCTRGSTGSSRDPDLKLVYRPKLQTFFFGFDQGSTELRSSNIKGKNPSRTSASVKRSPTRSTWRRFSVH